jgi:hypothetical protein
MRPDPVSAARVGSILVIAGLLGAAGFRESPVAGVRSEVVRLQAHFDSVDHELRTRDVTGLSQSQRQHRGTIIGWLKEYRNAGSFPINDRFAGKRVPFFRDSRGILCAMAYLIDRSGRRDIVDKVARTRNNAYIHDLTGDPALVEWIDENGLSVDEAARIQPSYEGFGSANPDRVSSSFAIATMLLGGGSMAFSAVNIVKPSLAGETAGLFVGAASIINGVSHLDENRGTKRVGYAGVYAGSLAVVTSAFELIRDRSRHHSASSRDARVSVAPSIIPMQRSYQIGVAGTARF